MRAPESASSEPPSLRVPFSIERYDAEPVSTGRTVLRPLRPTDVEDVYEYQRLDEVLRFIPWPQRTREEGYEHTLKRAGMRSMSADGEGVMFACVLTGEPSISEDGDRVIGDVMLRMTTLENAGLEIGWAFHPDFQGRGLATEAASAVLAIAFEEAGAHRVHANLDARNTASASLCRRLGMRHEATFIGDDYFKGEWTDTEVWSILRSEYVAR
jgi:RimJ/RimL family protein N-acetyltransferase